MERATAPAWLSEARTGVVSRATAALVLGAVGLAALAAGLVLAPPPLAFSLAGSLAGVASQLGTTLPAALLTLGAAAINLVAGAAVYAAIRGDRLTSTSEAALGGLVGAVIIDTALLYVLGATGTFRFPLVIGILAGSIVAAARLGWLPHLARPRTPGRWWPVAILIGLVWSGPVLLQLASPVVPFGDVLGNHVAPVQHLQAFGRFDPLTTTPAPVYGPSRTLLGYVALQGTVSTLTALPAALAVAAFILPQVGLVAIGLRLLARTVATPGAAFWILLTFALTQPFARLSDDRARIIALPLAVWTIVEFMRATEAVEGTRSRSLPLRPILALCVSLGATLLMHPVIGALAAATLLLLTVASPRRHAGHAVPALAGGAVIALPQALTMVGVPIPGLAALTSLPAGIGLTVALARQPALAVAASRALAIGLVAGAIVAVVALAGSVFVAGTRWVGDLISTMPILAITSAFGAVLAPRRVLAPTTLSALAVAAVVGTAAYAIPSDADSLLLQSLRFELPKTLLTWAPLWVAVAAAAALDMTLRGDAVRCQTPWGGVRVQPPPALRVAVVAAFLVAVALPIRSDPIDPLFVGERRLSESLATHLRFAERGYWQGYADPRLLVDREQMGILAAIQGEIDAGRIRAETPVLHVARSFQAWSATPLAVFTGVVETMASEDAEVSIHTVSGRLRPLTALDRLLSPSAATRFSHVVLEPAGLPAMLSRKIEEAGYEVMFANRRATIYHRAPSTR